MTGGDSSLNSALTNEDTKYKMHSYTLNIPYKLNFHTIFIQSLNRISKEKVCMWLGFKKEKQKLS